MQYSKSIDVETIRQRLSADFVTGELIWRARPETDFKTVGACKSWNSRFAGKVAGTAASSHGYRSIIIDYKPILAHRAIWAIYYGQFPKDEIDHIDRNRNNNSISNLRLATTAENSKNKSMISSNTSGITGVSFYGRTNKWTAQIQVDGKKIHLGTFDIKAEAELARTTANKKYGFSETHGELA